MLYWAVAFMLAASVAGLVGYVRPDWAVAGFVRWLFLLLSLLFVVTLGTHLAQNG